MDNYTSVGKNTRLLDAVGKATGAVKFGTDIVLPGMLVGRVLRSPHPHARIINIDTSKAARLPGVRAVITSRDVPAVKTGSWVKERVLLASGKVRHVGEPVAAVAAVDDAAVEEALSLIEVEYEPLPAVTDAEESLLPGAPLVHEDLPGYTCSTARKSYGNVLHQIDCVKGNVDTGFKEADIIVEGKYSTQFQHAGYIQPSDGVAQVDPSGKITVWCSTKSPFSLRARIAEALQIPLSRVRVITTNVGGDFGGKAGTVAAPLAAALTLKTGKPVKIVLAWPEEMAAANLRSRVFYSVKAGVKKDGAVTAFEARIVGDVGAYCETILPASDAVGTTYGPYLFPHIRTTTLNVHTNNVPTGYVRAPRQPQILFAVESHMDTIASKLGIDPIELRLKNCVREGDVLHDGRELHNVGLGRALARVKETVSGSPERTPWRGWGVACGQWSLAPLHHMVNRESSAKVVVNEDGSVILVTGVADSGGGQLTLLSQIVAEVLDLPLSRISVVAADTDSCPYEMGTVGSRTTYQVGNTVKHAAEDARSKVIRAAARKLLKDEQELAIRNGQVYAVNSPKDAVSLAALAKEAMSSPTGQIIGSNERRREEMAVRARSTPNVVDSPCYGAHAALVEVDPETGKLKVLRYVAVHDAGFAINPFMVEAQIQGGVVFGLGYALSEDPKTAEGHNLARDLTDYKLPVAGDAPVVEAVLVNQPSTFGPYGAKGIGEPPTTPVAAAIANAVFAASGARVTSLPITSEKVLRALDEKSRVG
ncbi:MAG: xanthine dehydrogenase family protein molybdopterin-binding subunit [Chloroflexi bacterium]|nr:xanthine dehydrogenase family protein molybdopterin-binding subunit [Chloroflexota bacterium]